MAAIPVLLPRGSWENKGHIMWHFSLPKGLDSISIHGPEERCAAIDKSCGSFYLELCVGCVLIWGKRQARIAVGPQQDIFVDQFKIL